MPLSNLLSIPSEVEKVKELKINSMGKVSILVLFIITLSKIGGPGRS